MGTTLTGTTPQDTYDSLIKVTDNGPLSATVKLLSDGLGNDSALAMSTARVGIGTTDNYSFNDDAKLAVANTSGNSTISIVSGTASNGYLAFADGTTGTDRYTGSINYNHSTNAMTLHTNAGNERMIITSAGNVGIGTSTPATTLHVSDAAATTATFNSTFGQLAISFANSGTTFAQLGSGVSVASTGGAADLGFGTAGQANASIIFATGANYLERCRITSTGNVGIGTTAPTYKLQVSGASPAVAIDRTSGDQAKLAFALSGTEYASIISNSTNGQNQFSIGPSIGWGGTHVFITNTVERVRVTDNGLTFNGDTAAANALDDYEEGTWTPTIAFGGAAVGATYSANEGTYTKIGRQVTVTGLLVLSSKGSSTGSARIAGMPFTIGSGQAFIGSAALRIVNITFTGQYSIEVVQASNTLALAQTSVLGAISTLTDANFANDSNIAFTATYFV